MQQASSQKGKRRANIKGICKAAEILGVNRTHLLFVLQGKRQSSMLLARYKNLSESLAPKNP